MPNWSTPLSIKQILNQKWEKGYILKYALVKDDFFPFSLKLNYPSSAEVNMFFSDIIDWRKSLKKHNKECIGYGYEVIEKEFSNRISGKNVMPTHIVIPTLNDAIKLLKKQVELNLFLDNANKLLNKWDVLNDWITKNPFKVLYIKNDCDCIINVLEWFVTNQERNLYLRQLDIKDVDTKFIENNKGILTELLDIILPESKINKDSRTFEERYYLIRKPELIRFRILDKKYSQNGLTDITVPLSEFVKWESPITRFFFTENEINFLTFPQTSNACVIFGRGYGVDLFKHIPWLKNMEIYYWGDIDTHGFNILSLARSFLPQIHSFLMTEEILLAHRELWVDETKQHLSRIDKLSDDEFALACKLQSNYWRHGVRLEQERIRFSFVERFICSLK